MSLYCTLITAGYLPEARVLYASLVRHNPGARLVVFLADEGEVDAGVEPFEVVPFADYARGDEVRQMAFYYEVYEFCSVLKPYMHEYLIERGEEDRWIYLDSDMYVNGSLAELEKLLDDAALAFTPHNTKALPDALAQRELQFIRMGLYNGGVFGMTRGDTARRFVAWWKSRIRTMGFSDRPGQYGDQPWLNFIPLYFPDHHICLHPGVNFGRWRVFGHVLARLGPGSYTVDDQPLICSHFSGYKLDATNSIYALYPDADSMQAQAGLELEREYVAELKQAGAGGGGAVPYSFGTFANGAKITREMRRWYFEWLMDGHWPGGSPFERPELFDAELKRFASWRRLAGLVRNDWQAWRERRDAL